MTADDDRPRKIRRQRGRGRTLRTLREAFCPRYRPQHRFRAHRPTHYKDCFPIRGLWGRRIVAAVALSRAYTNGILR